MKTKKEQSTATVRNKYTAQFKEQALERADRDGIPTVAKDLGLAESMLYSWRTKRRQTGQPFEEQKLQQAELSRLKRENARLEDEVAFLKKAAAYFAKQPKSTAWMQEVGQRRSSCREVRHDKSH
jgi:transposase